MTAEQKGRIATAGEATAPSGASVVPSPRQADRQVVLHGLPRSAEAEEAYLRSAREQAAIDIAAGW